MIFDFHNEQDTERQAFTGPKPTFWQGVTNVSWIGKKAMETAASGARAAAMAGSIFFPSEDTPREREPGRILPSKEDFGRFTDTYIEPAIRYWAPSPDEVGHAAKILGNVAGMALSGSPGNITLNAAMNTGANLIDQGVDPTTATAAGIGTGAVSYALTGLPQTGKNLLEKAGLVALNPLIGMGQDTALKKGLEGRGYKEQAASIDPLDPVSRGTDFLIGGLFGGLAHFAKAKEHLPVEVADAVDALHNQEKTISASPFMDDASPIVADAHVAAYNKALSDLHDGRPVEVSPIIREHMARLADVEAAFRNAEADAMTARDELGTIIERGDTITDAEFDALLHRAYGPYPPFRTEPHPETAQVRVLVRKETTALAEELAGEYPEIPRARLVPPHQDATPWSMTLEELFTARDTIRDWYDNLERSILGDQAQEWRRAVRRGDTNTTDRIESTLKPEEVDAMYGVGTKYTPDDFARLADARDTVRAGLELHGYTEKNLAAEIAAALYKVGDKKEPGQMTPSELEAYTKLDEAFKIIQERGMNIIAVSDEAIKLAAGHFPDPEDALYMLKRFVTGEQPAAPAGKPVLEAPQAEGGTAPLGDAPAATVPSGAAHPEAATIPGAEQQTAATHVIESTLVADVETLLREHGDVALVRNDPDGQPVTVTARQLLEEARTGLERTRLLEKAYQRAALCLGLD